VLASSSVDPLALPAIGRYELLLELGRGGMAILYLARARGVGGFSRLFAIKQILPHLAVDPPFVDMFLNEGRIAARLSHPNLCPVFELGQDRGELFLVMEYLDGVPWDALSAVAPRDARGLALTAGVLAQACEGLHYVHTFRDVDGTPMPIIHRDVSPQNLFVSTDGVCRMLDFGVSKIASDRRRTGTGLLKGKLPYIAPEQLHGELADPRSDVWAVGVMLWEALTGERLFDRDTDFLIYQAILGAPIPSVNAAGPAGAAPRYPAAIDRVIARALGRDRDTRYPSARDLGRDLALVAAEVGGAATREQIADAVAGLCGDQLAARRGAIAAAIARRSTVVLDAATTPSATSSPPAEGNAASSGEAAETISMMMRRDAIVVERSRRTRRWGALGLAAAVALVGGVAAWRTMGDGPAAAPVVSSGLEVASATPPMHAPPAMTGSSSVALDDKRTTNSPGAEPLPTHSTTAPSTGDPPGRKAPVGQRSSKPTGDSRGRHEPVADRRTTTVVEDPVGRGDPDTHQRSGSVPPPRPAATADTAQSKRTTHASSAPSRVRTDGAPAPDATTRSVPPTPVSSAVPASPAVSATQPSTAGWYAIDSSPYATIFIDERKIGDTPLDRIPLSAGAHRVRAVLADGRQRSFAIDIAADRKTSSGTLTW
jgi:eukaryotic-like serine/threonine-protein kinase